MSKGGDIRWDLVLSCREFWLLYYELALDWDSRAGRKKWKLLPNTENLIWALKELLQGHEIHIALPKGYSLGIAFEKAVSHRLYLIRGSSRQLLGWVDGHFHPDVFRWTEFKQIVTAAGSASPNVLPQSA